MERRPLFNRYGRQRIFLLVMCLLVFYPAAGLGFKQYNRVVKYDQYFKKYSKRFFGVGFRWQFFKAQAVAESNLKPHARSPVGAAGIMQIMPRTYKEIRRKNPDIKGKRLQPRWNIAAGIYYDRRLWNVWQAERPFMDRVRFMFGSYNAGKGNILKAQKAAANQGLNPNLWLSIQSSLPDVTGKRSQETIQYVEKIEQVKEVLR
ncbi:MAG: transglycosylase SLT domain-containing protein [Desulfobacterales bacterium]|jgi:membrane-bound lytic murein transglycosylase MltF